ncbi:MAG: Ig-like domain-containing protein [Rubrivivax sp.]|nr:Ig-like domain-containing protein [Rubrivivax sp.]
MWAESSFHAAAAALLVWLLLLLLLLQLRRQGARIAALEQAAEALHTGSAVMPSALLDPALDDVRNPVRDAEPDGARLVWRDAGTAPQLSGAQAVVARQTSEVLDAPTMLQLAPVAAAAAGCARPHPPRGRSHLRCPLKHLIAGCCGQRVGTLFAARAAALSGPSRQHTVWRFGMQRRFVGCAIASAVLLLTACGGGGGDSGSPAPPAAPATVTVTLATSTPGLTLTLDGAEAPRSFDAAPGTRRNIGAVTQALNGRLYTFRDWSQGGAAVQTLTTPNANTTLTANFADSGVTSNRAPSSIVFSPSSAARLGTAIAINASAGDPDTGDSVVRMQFLENGLPIGESTTAPFTTNWTPTVSGDRFISARAFDSGGLSFSSPLVRVTVAP